LYTNEVVRVRTLVCVRLEQLEPIAGKLTGTVCRLNSKVFSRVETIGTGIDIAGRVPAYYLGGCFYSALRSHTFYNLKRSLE